MRGRLPGDPGPWQRVRYALGFRLPPANHDWVRHDLTDAGWRGRLMARHLAVMLPICMLLALLPGEWWMHLTVPLLALLASSLTVVVSADDLRNARLRQHGLPPAGRAG
ncbi:DUF5313 family protein [Thermomonospora echinospora]|uniref:DUF5313 family protein n=1 Tax=Thermomonospora echinospora TaxID=1992 RepID=UPI000CDEBF7B|nr:DUF5313 family protein [Thermomonospora echinospora]